jgi:SAM-dependent methyltransferase
MRLEDDPYAKGMVAAGEEQFDLTPALDFFQYRMIKPHLGKDILEIGAGAGRITQILLQDDLCPNRVVVNEPSNRFYELLRRRIGTSQATLTQGETSELLKHYPCAFDAIFSVHVLEHVEDDRGFIENCLAMLKPGGKMVTLVPALQCLYSNLDREIGHYRRYNKKIVKRLIDGLDCNIVNLYYTNFLAIFGSLVLLKLGKIDYQKSKANKGRFIFLQKIYSRYLIPVIDVMERHVPMPIGLNLTFVLEKRGETVL